MNREKMRKAINALAELFEFGILQADTDPAGFLQTVTEEVVSLRASLTTARLSAQLEMRERAARLLELDVDYPPETFVGSHDEHAQRKVRRLAAAIRALHPSGPEETQAGPDLKTDYMPKVGGVGFRCECGCNVFKQPVRYMFVCNSCKATYRGEPSGPEETG